MSSPDFRLHLFADTVLDAIKTVVGAIFAAGVVFYKTVEKYNGDKKKLDDEVQKLRMEMIKNFSAVDIKVAEIKKDIDSFKDDHSSIKAEIGKMRDYESKKWHEITPMIQSLLNVKR